MYWRKKSLFFRGLFVKKSEELKNMHKQLLQSKDTEVTVDREEYLELLHEVVVLRHKLRKGKTKKPPG